MPEKDDENLTQTEWEVLNSLADGRECLGTMETLLPEELSISRPKLEETVWELCQRGLIAPDGGQLTVEALRAEPEEYIDQQFWFGMIEKGVLLWEKYYTVFSGEINDWSESWRGKFDAQTGQGGYVDGASRQVCLAALDRIDGQNKLWYIDRESLDEAEIDGFQAKYYKYLKGWHRISFKMKKR